MLVGMKAIEEFMQSWQVLLLLDKLTGVEYFYGGLEIPKML